MIAVSTFEDHLAEEGERRGRRDRGTRANAAAAAAGPAAVWPGHSSGTYRPLSVPDIERIHVTALDVLEKLGIGEPIPETLHYALPAGLPRWPGRTSPSPSAAQPSRISMT